MDRQFTKEQQERWRGVDLRHMRCYANICCLGIDFSSSSKSGILHAMAQETFCGSPVYTDGFIGLMEHRAEAERLCAENEERLIRATKDLIIRNNHERIRSH